MNTDEMIRVAEASVDACWLKVRALYFNSAYLDGNCLNVWRVEEELRSAKYNLFQIKSAIASAQKLGAA